jgi:hypothetical protein
MGPAVELLKQGAPSSLLVGHRSLSAKGTTGEVVEKPAIGPTGEIEVKGLVLRMGEGLKAIEDEWLGNRHLSTEF